MISIAMHWWKIMLFPRHANADIPVPLPVKPTVDVSVNLAHATSRLVVPMLPWKTEFRLIVVYKLSKIRSVPNFLTIPKRLGLWIFGMPSLTDLINEFSLIDIEWIILNWRRGRAWKIGPIPKPPATWTDCLLAESV